MDRRSRREAVIGSPSQVAPTLADPAKRARYRELLKDPSFFRFFVGQIFSSFGDWVGLLAILSLVKRIYDNEFAVAAVLLARMGPALFFGPMGGVLADRFNRKKVMVWCDIGRAVLIATLPFVTPIANAIPVLSPVVVLFIVSAGLEILSLLWQPAKDASVPDMVERTHYTHAYSLLLLAVYGTFPLSGVAFGLLANASKWVGDLLNIPQFVDNPDHVALFFDSFTFLISAAFTLTLRLRPHEKSRRPLNLRGVWEDMLAGLRFVRRHDMIRPWVIGIGGIFAGIGIFLSMALFFVSDVLGGGAGSFGLLVTAVGTGLGAGFILAGPLSRVLPKDVLFSSVVMAMGASMFWFGSVSTSTAALTLGGICGLFGGFAYPSGYALVHEKVGPEFKGRTTAAVNSVMRLALVGASATSPALVKIMDTITPGRFEFLHQIVDVRGVRVVMWLAGIFIFAAGMVTTKAVRVRWHLHLGTPGLLVVFEGGEGAGKTTQIAKLKDFLEARGRRVLVTREPGGTGLGENIRQLLLDPDGDVSPRTEALLYAADRAEHVEKVIRPALQRGDIVISDRYIDSSIAYQGLARGLGAEEVRDINRFGTGGLFPDVVFLLDFPADMGLDRSGLTDRIEQEGLDFHEKVREAYRTLAERYSDRFVTIDAGRSPDDIAAEIQSRVEPYLGRQAAAEEAPIAT